MKVARPQTAVYWAPSTLDGFGNVTFADPIEIAVRWENKVELFIDDKGKEQKSAAVVYPISAVLLEGYLYLGELLDLSSAEENDPKSTTAKEIRGVSVSINVRGTQMLYKAWL